MSAQPKVTIDGIELPGVKKASIAVRLDLTIKKGMYCRTIPDPTWITVEVVAGQEAEYVFVDKDSDKLFHVIVTQGDRVYFDEDAKLLYSGMEGAHLSQSRLMFGAYIPKPE